MVAEPRWSTPADIAGKVRRRWDSGALLTAYGDGAPFGELDVPLRGPRAGQVGDDLEGVRSWAERLERAAPGRYALTTRTVGGQALGRNELPARAVISSYAQAWRLLDVSVEVARFEEILRLASDEFARSWVLAHPHSALAVAEQWPGVLAARTWLQDQRGSGRFLREISAPGVDTKFVERHRRTLAALLDVPVGAQEFAEALGLHDRSPRVRVRFDREFAGLPSVLSEAAFRLDELAAVRVSVQDAVVLENEATFLSAPVPAEGVVLFGEGFRVSRLGQLPWLKEARVHYWGDLDTHGFAILDQLRAQLPQTRSLLMDADTLLEHRDRWVIEPNPTNVSLTRLSSQETELYSALVTGRWDARVRLEQERVDWAWAMDRWPVAD